MRVGWSHRNASGKPEAFAFYLKRHTVPPAMSRCAYCNQEGADTRDHVFPKGAFPKETPPVDPVIVPACLSCNNIKSRDDEWVRKWFVSMVGERSDKAMQVLYGPVARSIRRRPEIGEEILSKMVVEGKEVRMEINSARISKWVNQVVKGLFAHDHGQPMPIDWDLETLSLYDERLNPNLYLLNIARKNIPFPGAWNLKNRDVFAYGRSHVPENKGSVYVTVFYNHLVYITFLGPKTWLDKQRKIHKSILGRLKRWLLLKVIHKSVAAPQ